MNIAAGNIAGTAMAQETGKQGEQQHMLHTAASHAPPHQRSLQPSSPPLLSSQSSCLSRPCTTAGQGAVAPEDVAEAVLLPFRCSSNCVPEEVSV